MSTDRVFRIAAKGDGLTEGGKHVPMSAPGDIVDKDGTIERGPHYRDPPCRHFTSCGGCELQHCDDVALTEFISQRVLNAADQNGVVPGRVLEPHLSPPKSRRRASMAVRRQGRSVELGFRGARSHKVVDLRECHVLDQHLVELVPALRTLLGTFGELHSGTASLTLLDQGVDLGLKGIAATGLREIEALNEFAQEHALARLWLDEGLGPEVRWEPEPVTVTFAETAVGFPMNGFLQATADGEAVLVEAATAWLSSCKTVADLFSGIGTFAFHLAGNSKVLAVEGARDAHLACALAAKRSAAQVFAAHRDLFRNPLPVDEINRFDGVLLDPPRAGAKEQVAQIAKSTVERVVYVSCNPQSWARDAAHLVEAGYSLAEVKPVGQFRWSTHVELASLLLR